LYCAVTAHQKKIIETKPWTGPVGLSNLSFRGNKNEQEHPPELSWQRLITIRGQALATTKQTRSLPMNLAASCPSPWACLVSWEAVLEEKTDNLQARKFFGAQ